MVRLVLILAVIAAIAWATKPDEEKAEATLREQLILAVGRADVGDSGSAGRDLALAVCKMRPSDCYELVRPEIDTVYTDYAVFSRFDIEGLGKEATCYGAFTRFFCPGGLKDI